MLNLGGFMRFQRLLAVMVCGVGMIGMVQGAWAQAKDITGTWQGTLEVGKSLRTVVKISKADDGGWKAVFYSIDQSAQGLPVTSIKLDGSSVKMSLVAIGGAYDGKLTADGGEMDGTFTQGVGRSRSI
jgi:hypothetical protein